jgi:hypothetical protein
LNARPALISLRIGTLNPVAPDTLQGERIGERIVIR